MSTNAFEPGQGVPSALVAGDFWSWRVDGIKYTYPSDDYSLSYKLAPRSGGDMTTIEATADDDGWLVSVSSTTTTALTAGVYVWSLIATRISDNARKTVCSNLLTVKPDPTVATDSRTIARRHLDAINSVLEGRITKDVENYTIEGRALTRTPLADLHKLRSRYMAEVQAEERAARGQSSIRYKKVRNWNG